MNSLIQYAQKVELDSFRQAGSSEEYYQLLDEKINKIRTELEEKREKRRQDRLQMNQGTE